MLTDAGRRLTWILLTASALDLGAARARNHRPAGNSTIVAKPRYHARAAAAPHT